MRFCVRSWSDRRTAVVRSWFAISTLLGLLLCGCQNRDAIKRYTVKKLPPLERKAVAETPPRKPVAERMLAAIAPQGHTFWVFKLTGPKEAAAEQMENFLALTQSLKFSEDENAAPEWTLPEGWTELKDAEKKGTRFATLIVKGAAEEMTVTVTRLPFPADRPTDAVPLLIVNLWCEQLGLPEKKQADLTAEVQPKNAEVRQLEVAGTQVTLVNFLASDSPPPQVPEASPGQPKWTVPEGWKPTAGTRFSTAAFAVTDGKQSAKMTVSQAGGDLLGNLNRWRDQVMLKPWSPAEAAKGVKSLPVDGSDGTFVDFVGEDKDTGKPTCLLGAIVAHGDSTWFFKMTGDVELAQREKSNFEAFVQSVKFE